MKNNKFVTINIEGEDNIGVIDLGSLRDIHKDNIKSHFTNNVEPLLVQALQQHFDCPVKVSVPMLELKSEFPIKAEYVVVLELEEEDRRILVELNETWMYSA